MTSTNHIKSPYFRNTLQADDFEDKVHMLREKPHAIAIGFDADPNRSDCAFEIACRKTETESDLLASLIYVITKIAERRGLRTKVVFAPIIQQQAQVVPVVDEVNKITKIFGLFNRKPPTEPTNI